MPELIINLPALKHNIKILKQLCLERKLELLSIIKGCYAFPPLVQACQQFGIETFGLSKVSDGIQFQSTLDNRPTLINLPAPAEAAKTVQYFHASANSELDTIQALIEASAALKCHHGIILMVDNGDRREGILPQNVGQTMEKILSIQNTYCKFQGLGANLGCGFGTLPDQNNLKIMQDLALQIENEFGIEVKTVSIGGSVLLDWMEHHPLPHKINQLRLGEAILLGNIPSINQPHPLLSDKVLRFQGEVLEIKEKPATLTGQQGQNALGKTVTVKGKGWRKRAILNFGVVDITPKGLFPCLPGIEIITCNTDYTIVDVTECTTVFKPGDFIQFCLNYNAMIRAFLSPFVKKCIQPIE